MTKTLEKAFAAAAKLSAKEQDALGEWLLVELESDRKWDEFFERSQDTLEELAETARTEHRTGRTRELNPNKL